MKGHATTQKSCEERYHDFGAIPKKLCEKFICVINISLKKIDFYVSTVIGNLSLKIQCKADLHNSESSRAKLTDINLLWDAKSISFCCSLKQLLKQQLIIYSKSGCCNNVCNCESSHGWHAAYWKYVVHSGVASQKFFWGATSQSTKWMNEWTNEFIWQHTRNP